MNERFRKLDKHDGMTRGQELKIVASGVGVGRSIKMNERIRELADQILPNEKEFHQGDPKEWGYFFSGDELEKFAELIVRECLFIIDDERKSDMVNRTELWEQIKQHFGVE